MMTGQAVERSSVLLERHFYAAKVNLKFSAGLEGYCVKVILLSLQGFVLKSGFGIRKENCICIAKNIFLCTASAASR